MRRLLMLSISLVALTACASRAPAGGEALGRQISLPDGSYTEISVEELKSLQRAGELLLVNTHIPFEGDIPGTDLSIPYDQIDRYLDDLPQDQDVRIVLYCRSDRMSTIASETLVGLGYTNIYNLDGGMVAWEQTGYRLDR